MDSMQAGVSCLHWCPDGSCYLTIGYAGRGVSVNARTGKRMMTTRSPNRVSQITSHPPKCVQKEPVAAWSSHGYHLYVLEKEVDRLLMFEMVKCTLDIVHGADHIVLVEQRGADEDVQLRRTRVQIPDAYMNNWPIRCVAASPKQEAYAVAGSRGLAIYSRKRDRWRLFGNVSHEQGIVCEQLLWYHKEILCVVDKGDNRATRLLFYPRSHLDNNSILAKVASSCKPFAVDASAEKETIVIRYRSAIVVYRVTIDEDADSDFEYPRFNILPVETVSLSDMPFSMNILPRGGCRRAGISDFLFPKLICLDIYGRARIVDTESAGVKTLLDGVQQLFCHSFSHTFHRACSSAWPSSFDHCIFLVTATSVELWVAAVDPNCETRFGENAFASIGNGVAHFIGATTSTAALVSISQKTYYVLPDTMPSFEIESQVRPCLDVLLAGYLRRHVSSVACSCGFKGSLYINGCCCRTSSSQSSST